jgi:hypothetical protein
MKFGIENRKGLTGRKRLRPGSEMALRPTGEAGRLVLGGPHARAVKQAKKARAVGHSRSAGERQRPGKEAAARGDIVRESHLSHRRLLEEAWRRC